ncbi:hypothetical protein [Mucilaginibacter mallensis]|uniref:hypothetical protein n=1 Tax=Mucilaginibacter mallensis TaxID=652787 RepID=UPI0012F7E243|nr:hypothetical protein [Mucilaginibacter mallensis]
MSQDQTVSIDGGSLFGTLVDTAISVLNSTPAGVVAAGGLGLAAGLVRGFVAGIK